MQNFPLKSVSRSSPFFWLAFKKIWPENNYKVVIADNQAKKTLCTMNARWHNKRLRPSYKLSLKIDFIQIKFETG
jgi:hypothetical protein